jgi:FlaA1/EpsC-like NDP-sugar epimerase
MVLASNYAAFWLRYDGEIPPFQTAQWLQALPLLLAVRILGFIPFRLYYGLWRYVSISDLCAIIGAVCTTSLAFYVAVTWVLGVSYPPSVFVIDALLLVLVLGGIRMGLRVYRELRGGVGGRRVLIFGAGDAGELVVRDMKTNPEYGYRPVGFVDDDRSKVGRRIHGVPVLGTRDDIPRILEDQRPDEVLLAIPGAEPPNMRAILRAFEPFKLPIKTLPRLRDIIDGRVELGQIRSLAVEDLLLPVPADRLGPNCAGKSRSSLRHRS